MADKKETFVRRSAPFSFGSALYTCTDYILLVDRSATAERYRRLYFKDIQSIQILVTKRWIWMAVLWGLLSGVLSSLALFLLFSVDNGTGIGFGVFMALLASIFVMLFVKNFVAGKTCRVYVSTAVQRVIVPTVERVRRARRLVAEFEAMIVDAQGEMTEDELKEELAKGWEEIRSRKSRKQGIKLKGEKVASSVGMPTGPGAVEPQEQTEHEEILEADSEAEAVVGDRIHESIVNDNSELEGEPDVPVS